MSLRAMLFVFDQSEAKLGARLVLLALAEYAHEDGTSAFPTIESIVRKTRMSERAVRTALRRLEDDHEVERVGVASTGAFVYELVQLRDFGGQFPTFEGGSSRPGRGADSAPNPRTGSKNMTRERLIASSWQTNSPPLIGHREAYYSSSKTLAKIRAALRVYPAEAVAGAIANYATVLGSGDYRWSYSWTLQDFLARGLDKFVAEARPFENYREHGRPQTPTDDQLRQIPDL